MRTDPAWIDARGVPSRGRDCLASMGIYLFNRQTLVDVLTKTDYRDFGKEVFPASIRTQQRAGPPVRRLLGRHRHDQVVLRGQPGPGRPAHRPSTCSVAERADLHAGPASCRPRAIDGATVRGSLVADGCTHRSRGRDREQRHRPALPHRPQRDDPQFDPDGQRLLRDEPARDRRRPGRRRPPLGIGDGTLIEGAIIDKNCRIGRNVRIVNDRRLDTSDETP